MEDVRRVFRKVLKTEHDDHNVARSDDPKARRRRRVHDRDHKQRCRQEEQHEFRDHKGRDGDTDVYPGIDQGPHTECKLPESFYIENFRHEVEEHVDRAEAVLDEVTALNLKAEIPVVVEKALYGRQRDQRKTVKEEHVIVIPAVNGREVLKQDQERDKARKVRHDHSDRGNKKIRTIAHLAL